MGKKGATSSAVASASRARRLTQEDSGGLADWTQCEPVVLRVFQLLAQQDLARAAAVCKFWAMLVRERPVLWARRTAFLHEVRVPSLRASDLQRSKALRLTDRSFAVLSSFFLRPRQHAHAALSLYRSRSAS